MGNRLQGKVAVVTGAASGIGKATVDLFVREGARVVAADIQDAKGRALEAEHGKAVRYVHCDVMDEASIKSAIETAISAFGRLDCLFNNAGSGGPLENAETMTAEGFAAVMNLHVRAAFFGIKHASPIMRAQGGGSIISTASIAGLQNGWGPILYSTAKAAIVHLTKLAAAQLGAALIRVNCICPGAIATPIFAKGLGLEGQEADATVAPIREALRTMQPVQRAGLPEDIAEGALYLASDGARFVSGHALVIDGAITVGPTGEGEQHRFAPILMAMGVDVAALAAMTGPQPM